MQDVFFEDLGVGKKEFKTRESTNPIRQMSVSFAKFQWSVVINSKYQIREKYVSGMKG